jgi:hypothetical protein
MIGIIDFILIILLIFITTYIIIFNMSSIIDIKLNTLKSDIVNIKCEKDMNIHKSNIIEKYGSLSDKVDIRDSETSRYISNKSNQSTEDLLQSVISEDDITKIENPNFNTYNNLPYLIDPQNPNEGYYYNRVKLVTNPNSPLLKKADENMKRIDILLKNCSNKNLTNTRDISGYNNYENLSEDSYANVTSIGKSLLTPYTSYPLPS